MDPKDGARGHARQGTATDSPSRVDAAGFDEVIGKLREIERQSGLQRTLAIGELILKRFYGGDPAIWRERRRNKNNSIRRLAKHADCPFCRSALNDAVAVYVVSRDSPCVRTFGHIGASHVAQVLPLPPEQRELILRRAELERWSVRTLRERVVSLRRGDGERRGRPSIGSEARALSALKSSFKRLAECVERLTAYAPLSPEGSRELRHLASVAAELGARLRDGVQGRSSVARCSAEQPVASTKRSA